MELVLNCTEKNQVMLKALSTQMKDKMQNKILEINAKQYLRQFKYSFIIKTLSNLGIKGTDFNITKPTCNKSTGNMMLNEEQKFFSKDQEPAKDAQSYHFLLTSH